MKMEKNMVPSSSTSEYWERSYRSGKMEWDIGESTPIFNQWIETCKKSLSICVVGAGNGWDAISFAKKGHLVTAVDFAESAVNNMQAAIKKSAIKMNILHMDIFDLNIIYSKKFDVVVEYTCFCAIDPYRRRDYLKMVQHILKPNGELVGLLFPIDKDPSDGGPPYAVDLNLTIKFISKYFSLVKQEIPILSIKPREGREVFVIFKNDKL